MSNRFSNQCLPLLQPRRERLSWDFPPQNAIPDSAPKSRKRPCANPDAAKNRRCIKDSEAGPSSSKACGSGLVSRQRAKVFFLCLCSDCF
ncbi:hypothetical protein Bca52824_001742 [Brassica carinata]|uniref:Uncharacterized protein n=1 Tax=Brassica carinata TaxID=52824 RepID=A0A8X8BDC6_BRACI|nr:hypothetical protein Bca52824_001742 [Brassica carinata]